MNKGGNGRRPPAPNSREQRNKDWLVAKLDAVLDAHDKELADLGKQLANPNVRAEMLTIAKDQLAKLRAGNFPIEQAERGNIEPLQRKYQKENPRLAPFINLPPLKRGERRQKQPDRIDAHSRLDEAVREVGLMRALCRKNPNRRLKGRLMLEKIAAERWELTPDEVSNQRLSRERLKSETPKRET